VGTKLLKKFSAQDPKIGEIRSALIVTNNWSKSDFSHAEATLKNHVLSLDSRTVDLGEFNEFLVRHKGCLFS
jgi:hypothetical protein